MCYLIFMSGSTLLQAQKPSPHPSFRNFGTNEGLPSPEVYCVMQDHQGYMWFGTDNGVSRFNGYTFTNFGPANGLQSNVVFNIVEDSSNRIWFGTMSGELFIFKNDTIVPYTYNPLILNYRNKYSIANLLAVNEQELVTLSLRRLGILQIDKKGETKLYSTKVPLGGMVVLSGGKIWQTSIGRTGDANYWDVSYDHYMRQVFYVEIVKENRTDTLIVKKRSINGSPFNAFSVDSVNQVFLLQAFNNIYLMNKEGVSWNIEFTETINSLQLQPNGQILLSLNGEGGLRSYDKVDDLRLHKYTQLLERIAVSQTFVDDACNFWVATLGSGIFYSKDTEMILWNNYNDDAKSNLVTAIAIKSETEIFFGLNNGLVYLLNLATGQTSPLPHDPLKDQSYVNCLYYNRQADRIYKNGWVLSLNNQWTPMKHKLPDVKSGILLAATCASGDENCIWGSSNRGFYKIDLLKNQTILHSDIELGITDRTFSIYEDKCGRVWVGLQTGIAEFDNGKLVKPIVNHQAFNMRTEAIEETADSTLIFGTKGLGVVFWKEDKIINIMEKEGLTSNMIEDIHVDENGIIWVATLSGLNKITLSAGGKPVIRAITIAQGLPSNEIYQIASVNGQVWLATGGGLVKYHELPPAQTAAPPFFTNLKVNTQHTSFTETHFPYYCYDILILVINLVVPVFEFFT
ncbi:hypothetical protein C7N43_36315, partial [Sphingobacteriales bacterium UPWRP_1]